MRSSFLQNLKSLFVSVLDRVFGPVTTLDPVQLLSSGVESCKFSLIKHTD